MDGTSRGVRSRSRRRAVGLAIAALIVSGLAAAPGASADVSKGQAFGGAGAIGAKWAGRLNAQNVSVDDCVLVEGGSRRCKLNVWDDDWAEGGLDCYWTVLVRPSLRRSATLDRCQATGNRPRISKRQRRFKTRAFAAAARVAAQNAERFDADGVLTEYCDRVGSERSCRVHIHRTDDDESSYDCHFSVTSRLTRSGRLRTRTVQEDCDYPGVTSARAASAAAGGSGGSGHSHAVNR